MIRGRLRRHRTEGGSAESGQPDTQYLELEPGQLSGVFNVPDWLRNVGLMSWLLVGAMLLLAALVWLLAMTQVISIPVIVAAIMATVGSPVVAWLHSHRIPRAAGAVLLMLGIIAVGALMAYAVVVGIDGQASSIAGHLSSAKDTIGGWLQDLGLDSGKADSAKDQLGRGASDSASALIGGLLDGIGRLSSLAFFLAMTILSLFFLLKDGPTIRAWGESHMGVPAPVAKIVTQRTIGSMRGYFLGVTIVAAFSAVVVGIGTLILGVPLLGTIVAVTFIAGYIPYIGAWSAAIFSVLLALGSSGTDAAIGMIVVQFLANGALQQLVQPFAMGAALGIHPLAVLIVTIAGGALFGTVGLIVAAPLVSAIVRISADLARVKAAEEAEAAGAGDVAGGGRAGAGPRLTDASPRGRDRRRRPARRLRFGSRRRRRPRRPPPRRRLRNPATASSSTSPPASNCGPCLIRAIRPAPTSNGRCGPCSPDPAPMRRGTSTTEIPNGVEVEHVERRRPGHRHGRGLEAIHQRVSRPSPPSGRRTRRRSSTRDSPR